MDAADLDPEPHAQLAAWVQEAREGGVVNADAMALATATARGACRPCGWC